jgi:hypothetical protein
VVSSVPSQSPPSGDSVSVVAGDNQRPTNSSSSPVDSSMPNNSSSSSSREKVRQSGRNVKIMIERAPYRQKELSRYDLARNHEDARFIVVSGQDVGFMAPVSWKDKVPLRAAQHPIMESTLQTALQDANLPKLSRSSFCTPPYGSEKDWKLVLHYNSDQDRTAMLAKLTAKSLPSKPLTSKPVSVDCADMWMGNDMSLDDLHEQLKPQLVYYGLECVSPHSVIKKHLAVQFTCPMHLLGLLPYLMRPGTDVAPGARTVWKRLMPKTGDNRFCKHCVSFGHSDAFCPSKSEPARCLTCPDHCQPGSCPFRGHGKAKCQSPRCPTPREPHHTCQCSTVMCHRREKEINASYFLPGTPAYKANCMIGGVPFLLEQAGGRAMAASAPLAAGGATYASAAAGSTRVPVVRQPAAPVARAPAQQQSLSPMLESRFQAIEAVQMALKNDVAGVPGEVRKLTDLVLALQKEVASLRRQLQGVNGLERRSTPTKKTASPRGGKGGKQKRKHSRSRSPSPALTHTTSFSALAQEDSEDDTQGNQSMSDNEWKQVSTKTKQR